jgi:hypothetical protein
MTKVVGQSAFTPVRLCIAAKHPLSTCGTHPPHLLAAHTWLGRPQQPGSISLQSTANRLAMDQNAHTQDEGCRTTPSTNNYAGIRHNRIHLTAGKAGAELCRQLLCELPPPLLLLLLLQKLGVHVTPWQPTSSVLLHTAYSLILARPWHPLTQYTCIGRGQSTLMYNSTSWW